MLSGNNREGSQATVLAVTGPSDRRGSLLFIRAQREAKSRGYDRYRKQEKSLPLQEAFNLGMDTISGSEPSIRRS
jgi:hypothetical protein